MLRLIFLLILALPATVAAAPDVAARTTATAEAVVLGAFDQIEVNFDNYPDLKTTTRVGADGNVILPLVGTVQIGGLIPPDAANEIETHYVNGGFIKLPTVRIEIIDYQSRKVSVLGQVNQQGLIMLDRGYSIAEILAKAGGLAADAADTAVIIRARPDGGSERLTIDIGQLVAASGTGALTEVRAGDVVFVPKAPTFSVIGAVIKAGTYPLKSGMTVDQALAAAGDLAAFGTRSRLKVRRIGPEGGAAKVIDVQPEAAVQPGDIIVVRERLF